MEKVITGLKFVYYLLLGVGLFVLSKNLLSEYRYNSKTIPIQGLISSLVLVFLIFVFVSSFFIFLIGILRRISAKDDQVKRKAAKKMIINAILGILVVVIIWVFINLVSTFYVIDMPSFTPDHFRTNIFTGQCDYGGASGNLSSDPWYYKPDCSVEKKIQTAKSLGFYESRLNECNQYCNALKKNYFCNTNIITVGNTSGGGPDNLLCTEITNCPQIDCEEHKNNRVEQMKEGF